MRYIEVLIRSFGDQETERLFHDHFVRKFQGVAARAKRKLEALHAAARLEDLAVPPSNRLEKLGGKLSGLYSVRVNDQWRVVFRWRTPDAYSVSIVDYH
jgi:toxin HigB-1